jgi:hypothetical protein
LETFWNKVFLTLSLLNVINSGLLRVVLHKLETINCAYTNADCLQTKCQSLDF